MARGAKDKVADDVWAAAIDATVVADVVAALDAAVAARGPLALALVYSPFAPATSVRAIAERVAGTLTYVLTSEWGAPGADRAARDVWAPDGPGETKRLTLGWVAGLAAPRWHTPREVSDGALAMARSDMAEGVLGALRPWEERPQ
jgi:hypothetical protein